MGTCKKKLYLSWGIVPSIGCQDYKCKINPTVLHLLQENFCEKPNLVDARFKSLANEVMRVHSLDPPTNYQDALMNFFFFDLEMN